MTSATADTWFVTGTSQGLGLQLVKQLLARGDNVAATTRSVDRLRAALDGANTDRLLALPLDLTAADEVDAAVRQTTERFGGLDIVVNNAGYGHLAAVEETTDVSVRQMFDVQIFGLWNVLRSALPILRSQRSGHIINVSSILGLTAMPGWGLYCAAKFALEGLSESLAAEVSEFGGKVTIVEPGYFRTEFLTPTSISLPESTTEGYESIREMTQNHLDLHGAQLGDPVKGAAAIIEIATSTQGPLRQLLGSDSYTYATAKIAAMSNDFEAGRQLALTTDHSQS